MKMAPTLYAGLSGSLYTGGVVIVDMITSVCVVMQMSYRLTEFLVQNSRRFLMVDGAGCNKSEF